MWGYNQAYVDHLYDELEPRARSLRRPDLAGAQAPHRSEIMRAITELSEAVGLMDTLISELYRFETGWEDFNNQS